MFFKKGWPPPYTRNFTEGPKSLWDGGVSIWKSTLICGLKCVPKMTCWSPNSQYQWIWAYLERVFADVIKTKWGHQGLGRAFVQWLVWNLVSETGGSSPHDQGGGEWSTATLRHGMAGLLATARGQERGMERVLPESLGEQVPADTWSQTCGLQNCERRKRCCSRAVFGNLIWQP